MEEVITMTRCPWCNTGVMRYVALINTPGYLPMDDDPPEFDTPAEAWQYLADERRRGEDDSGDGVYSETVDELDAKASAALSGEPFDRLSPVYGDTPGCEGNHDLGLIYSVQESEECYPDPDQQYKEDIEHEDPDEWYDRMRDEREGLT